MLPQVSADDARRRSDEAVRRLREESARRVEQRGRVRAFSSWCALATLASGISLAALNAHDARLQEQEALRAAAAARDAQVASACAERSTRFAAIGRELNWKLARALTEEERAHIRAEAAAQKAQAIEAAAARGCGSSMTAQAAWIPEPAAAPVRPKPSFRRYTCSGEPMIKGL